MSEVKFGCHVDLMDGDEPDGCVFDYGNPGDCRLAQALHQKGKGRADCSEWRPIAFAQKEDPDWADLLRRMRDHLYVVAMEDLDLDAQADAATLADEADAFLKARQP